MSKPPPYDNRAAVNTLARIVTTAKGGLLLSLTEELAGKKETHAIPFYHLRRKLGLSLAAEMKEVKKHWHKFEPRDAGLKAQEGGFVTYAKRKWKVVSAGQYSLILLAL